MIQRLQPRLAGSGLSLEHFLGIVREVSGPGGIGTGPRALMMVGNLLQGLMKPSKGAATALEALGISGNQQRKVIKIDLAHIRTVIGPMAEFILRKHNAMG
jgi:hypothetical protein